MDRNSRSGAEELKFKYLDRFFVTERRDGDEIFWEYLDVLSPSTRQVIRNGADLRCETGRRDALASIMPPCIALSPLRVGRSPLSNSDLNFWQYPAVTERLAWERHSALPLRQSASPGAPVACYLGLPWATYIDKGREPLGLKAIFKNRIRGYRELSEHWRLKWGVDVQVHTVCQHIYWKRLLPFWRELNVTDVHLAHCEEMSTKLAAEYGIRVHSWPLAAANLVNSDRRDGLEIGRPLEQRQLLASFIGAHMPHYRSEVRLHLAKEVASHSDLPVVFKLSSDWHFNDLVYGFQVKGIPLGQRVIADKEAATREYNAVLSDSVFSLCPEGAGPNTIRLWESLATGAIPVVIVDEWIWPEPPQGAPTWDQAVIHVPCNQVRGLLPRLQALFKGSPERLTRMQQDGMRLYQAFQTKLCF